MHVEELKMNQSIGLIKKELKRTQSEKLVLDNNISDVTRVLSDVKRNNIFSFNKVHFQIIEIASNMSSVRRKLLTKIDDLTTKINANVSETNIRVKDIVQNVSFLFNNSMSNIQTISEAVQKCVEMNKLLETTVDEKIILSSVNLTKHMNHTEKRIDVQVSELNQSIRLINEKVKHLQKDKSNLENYIAETKNEISELRRNETTCVKNLNFRITEIALNMSSVANEFQAKLSYLALNMAKNISRINDNHSLSLNSLLREANLTSLHIDDLTQNLSLVEKRLESQFNSCNINIEQTVQDKTQKIDDTFLEINQNIDFKWSSFNESLYRVKRTLENDFMEKNRQLSSRLAQLSGTVGNIQSKVGILESSNNGQTNQLSRIESTLSTASTTLRTMKSELDNNIPSKYHKLI